MDEALQIRRKRLLYQAAHRGTQEGDLVIGGFAAKHLDGLDETQLDAFEALINEPDAEIMDWICARAMPPEHLRGGVLDMIIDFKKYISSN